MGKYDLYKDIQTRTGGEVYIGVVGPVRTGKSTFIRTFAELILLPEMNVSQRTSATDELPASASGRMITTVEPKFIPRHAASVALGDGSSMKIRMVDCVGFPVDGADGFQDGGIMRMVKTPWQDQAMPFPEAARFGTKKVITDHATVGIVITTDGSFGELPGSAYLEAERDAIWELQRIGKPFLVIVNSARPHSEEARQEAERVRKEYDASCMVLNCEKMEKHEAEEILQQFLLEFPLTKVIFQVPKWVETLDNSNWLKQKMLMTIKQYMKQMKNVRDMKRELPVVETEYMKKIKTEQINLSDGSCEIQIEMKDSLYYQILSEMTGMDIHSEYQLISLIKEMSQLKQEYEYVAEAVKEVKNTGYGMIKPLSNEIVIEEPEMMKQGSKYGVRIKANSPSIHLIRAEVESEVSPVVGSEAQAQELIEFMNTEGARTTEKWKTLIFGKSVEQLMEEGISGKLAAISEENQKKLQHAMKRIVNDSRGRLFFIVI